MDLHLKKLYQHCRKLEALLENGESLTSFQIEELVCFLEQTSLSRDDKIRRLGALRHLVSQNLNLQSLMTLIVPIERLAKAKVTDAEILVTTQDVDVAVCKNDLIVVLDNIRSAFNLGAILRTCEALGVKEVLATGYTPLNSDEKVKKTSMGTWSKVKFGRLRDLNEAIESLKERSYEVVALETVEGSCSLFDASFAKKTAFVFGNERFGISKADLADCDKILSLPVFGSKNSLNVNAALTSTCYEWVRRYGK